MTRALFFVILFAGVCWTEAGEAFEPWDGKATTGLNVRKFPRVGGQVVDWLKEGQRITINDEKEKWYKIIFEIEGKRYREGWVHRRYIQKVSSQKEEISSALAKVRAGITEEESPKKNPLDASVGENHLPNEKKKVLDNVHTPTATLVVEEQAYVGSQEDLLSGKKDVRAPKEQARTDSQVEPPALKMGVNSTTPPANLAVSKQVDTLSRADISVVQKSLTQELPPSHDDKDLIATQESKGLGKLVLRLMSVVLSCLALLFSYKAMKLAKISYNTAMQFQRFFQVRQQGESG